ncbi:hypothetical protein SCLARK_001311 [Spiroplasma clarkii]|uniref:hypothetical protein n=1 Tax=Spiroplasma clarkii TaxID=2139 RepID=UPI000B559B60|nr:hypothetical protein [Spiroplasma clarkii]ARU91847.1 hypothetical protein SCLARK_001311 [Spiroplasma clarkii]
MEIKCFGKIEVEFENDDCKSYEKYKEILGFKTFCYIADYISQKLNKEKLNTNIFLT